MFIFEEYNEIDVDTTKLESILQEQYLLCISGISRVGKTTHINKIKKKYYKSITQTNIKELNEDYKKLKNESILMMRTILLIINVNDKNRNDVYKFVKTRIQKHVNIIIECNPNDSLTFESISYIYRIKCPRLDRKREIIREISNVRFKHEKNLEYVINNYDTWHDCLLAIELKEHGYDIYPYGSMCDELLKNLEDYEVIKYRKYVYSILMCNIPFTEVFIYIMKHLIEKHKDYKEDIIRITSEIEAMMKLGNKEVYYLEYYLLSLKELIYS